MLGNNSNYAHGTNIYVLFNIRPRVGDDDDDCSPTVVERITAILKTLVVIKC